MTRKEIFLKSAEYYIEHEMSIIPVSKSKIPLIPWKQYQEERATLDQVDKWLDEYPDMQLGVVTGKISSIIVVDIEQGGDVSWLPKTAIVSTG